MIRLASHLRRCLPVISDDRTDGELLAAFLDKHDEAAFAELLRRHGPLVWSACRRLLPDPADAEDAFQAAFLVLVRRARRLAGQPAIGPWLYKVAAWTARNVRRRNARSLARRVPLSPVTLDPAPGVTTSDVRLDLDAALLSLPEKYRTPLVLCHLQGWSRHDAAARLGCPEGTLSSLLARGLVRLRARLAGRDPAPYLAVGSFAVPAVLASATARAADAARMAAAGSIPVSVSQLAEGVLRMFWVQKATAASFAMIAVFAFGVGVGTTISYGPATVASDTAAPPTEKAAPPAAPTDIDKQIAELTAKLDRAQVILRHARSGLEAAAEKLKLTERTGNAKDIAADREALDQFKKNAIDAEVLVRDLQDQIAALEARRKAVGAAAPADLDKEIAELKAQIDAAKAIRENALDGLKLSAEKLKVSEKAGDPKAIAADRLTVDRYKENVVQAEMRIADLQDKLKLLEARRKAVGAAQPDPKPQPRKVAADDVERDLLTARNELLRLKAEWDLLAAKSDDLKKQAALIDARAKQLMDLIKALEDQRKVLEDQRKRDGKKTEMLVAGGSVIEVTVAAEKAPWPGAIREYGPDGKLVGTLTYDNTAVLQVALGRVLLDPKGPRELKIVVDKDASVTRLKAVLEACRAAGFKEAKISGSLPRAGLGILARSPDGGEKPVAGWVEYKDTLLSLDDILGSDLTEPDQGTPIRR